ncbi:MULTISPECIES: CDP-2,3-bis-(O-geranylgeranyl)-sn-glycerol synthase [Methanocalculus]|uniref:CDP-2,3-bis-(O-geranylgeranyl)-sn-glycerol synthase n=1 Tax=Methanocalculus TaxID=71151 RepID=UPI0020A21754|nr:MULTISPECIES: CDP-2,3-bis-(O-geranylgeranyl)-sn-glycerol synthase [unclassified Methanocalculus]
MLPAYLPNPVAAATGGGRPIDGGRVLKDGERIFGDGKTIRGLVIGIGSGLLIGLLQILAYSWLNLTILPEHTLLSVTLLASGALLGDLGKSFIKRRRGIGRGEAWPLADQYDLVLGAFIALLLVYPVWFISTMTFPIILAILVITPLLHRGVNIIGYILGIKEVPW